MPLSKQIFEITNTNTVLLLIVVLDYADQRLSKTQQIQARITLKL